MSEIIEKAREKIEKDYTEIVSSFLEIDKVDIIDSAYELAHFNEVVDFFDCIDDEYPPFEDEVFNKIIDFKGNAIQKIWRCWMDYCHPERYNFFCYEDLADIIKDSFL